MDYKKLILDFPEQFKIDLGVHAKPVKYYDNVIVCGMGGSGIAARLLSEMIGFDLFIHQSYGLPKNTKAHSLVVCVSYSGNTAETLSAFKEARKRKLSIACICSGGKLESYTEKFNIQCIKIPAGLPPRLALGYSFTALASLLEKKVLNKIKRMRLNPKKFEAKGKSLAKEIKGKIPIIYSSSKALAYVWKTVINETAKNPAFSNCLPEAIHNEIESFVKAKNFFAIFLHDKSLPKLIKQEKAFKNLISTKGIKTKSLETKTSSLSRIFSSVLLAHWTSYYLAKSNRVDPVKISLIERLKKKP